MAVSITPNEWHIMELLWQSPLTLMELVRQLGQTEGWAKSTVATMVRRMESKGLIRYKENGRTKTFCAAVEKEEVIATETSSLLHRAYDGSIGLLVSTMAKRNDLTRADIDELYAILQKAEEEMK